MKFSWNRKGSKRKKSGILSNTKQNLERDWDTLLSLAKEMDGQKEKEDMARVW